MFKKSIIKEVLKYAHKRNKSLDVVQRYLSIHYRIHATMNVLKKRNSWIKIKNKLC
tara:strand:+ start:2219 stop:2386 length:168 start_codon:yes stop_codon:yes gene_type:complete